MVVCHTALLLGVAYARAALKADRWAKLETGWAAMVRRSARRETLLRAIAKADGLFDGNEKMIRERVRTTMRRTLEG